MILYNDYKNQEIKIKISKKNYDYDIADALCCIAMLNYKKFVFFIPEGMDLIIDEELLKNMQLKISSKIDNKYTVIPIDS